MKNENSKHEYFSALVLGAVCSSACGRSLSVAALNSCSWKIASFAPFFLPAISRPVDSILGQFRRTGAALALRGRRALAGFRDESKHVHANVLKRVQMVAAREEREATQWRRRSGPALGCLMRPVSDGRGGGGVTFRRVACGMIQPDQLTPAADDPLGTQQLPTAHAGKFNCLCSAPCLLC